jgi:hypothetical protein
VAEALITKTDLERRLGPDVVRRIFDHNSDGVADAASLTQICEDASSKVRGALGLVYDLDQFDPTIATELRRIALDAALAMTARDFHGAYPRDWGMLWEQVKSDLADIRKGMSNLATKEPPERAANQGGTVVRDGSNGGTRVVCHRPFSGNWGDF